MTIDQAEAAARADPRVVARNVHNFLRNEMVSDLYELGMTIEQAEAAARADPRVVARTVQNFLRNEMVSATEQRQAMNEIYRYST